MNQDLKKIKKQYGEDMMHLCRKYFQVVLETEGLLPKLLMDNFDPSKELYNDIQKYGLETKFKNYIFYLYETTINLERLAASSNNKSPEELLKEKGYNLYECKTEEDIQSFKKYFAKGRNKKTGEYINEELCTFDGNRLKSTYVFFAVKENVDEIKRENFPNPERQDEYGTSVMSIQFTKDKNHTVEITNRYNHTVENPDATFSGNLDKIVPGLTDSFAIYYGMKQNNNKMNFTIPKYIRATDNVLYKYSQKIGNVYYCPNNVIIDNDVAISYPKERYIIFDYFILDLQNKKISTYTNKITDKLIRIEDSFTDTLSNIENISITTNPEKEEKTITITLRDAKYPAIIKLNKENRMIEYQNDNIIKVGDFFLHEIKCLKRIILTNAEEFGRSFAYEDEVLEYFDAPKAKVLKEGFNYKNNTMKVINLFNIEDVYDDFMPLNQKVEKLIAMKAIKFGSDFLRSSENLKEIIAPNLEYLGNNCFEESENLEKFNLENLKIAGSGLLRENRCLKEFWTPNLISLGAYCGWKNTTLRSYYAPNLKDENRGPGFFTYNQYIGGRNDQIRNSKNR